MVPNSAVLMLSGAPAARMLIFHLESPAPFLLLGSGRGFFFCFFNVFIEILFSESMCSG